MNPFSKLSISAKKFIEHKISIKELYFSLSFWFLSLVAFLAFNTRFQTGLLLVNLAIALLIYLVIILITNRLLLSGFITLLLAVSFNYIKDIKWQFLMQNLAASDVMMLKLMINHGLIKLIYEYATSEIYLVLTLLLINFILLWSKYDTLLDKNKLGLKNYFGLRIMSIVLSLMLILKLIDLAMDKKSYFYQMIAPNNQVNTTKTIRSYGPFADILFSIPELTLEPISVNSEQMILDQSRQNQYSNLANLEDMPDIIVILNESTFDPSYLDYDFADNFNYDFFKEGKYTKYNGILNVNTYGGSSWISEYEVNTGISHKSFSGPSYMPFITLAPITKTSLMLHLNSHGYSSHIIYPVDKNFSLAKDAYTQLGSHSITDIYEYGYKPTSWQNVPDEIIGNMIIETLDKNPKEPKYIFASTMLNHGPHNSFKKDEIGCSTLMNENLCSKLNDYLTRLDLTNQDQIILIDKLMKRKKKTIIVNFGDHLPSFEGYSTQLRFNRKIKDYYKTFYNIHANFEIKKQDLGDYPNLDISLISGLILDMAKLNNHDFYLANSYIRKKCAGQVTECSKNPDNKELINSYQSLIGKQLNFN